VVFRSLIKLKTIGMVVITKTPARKLKPEATAKPAPNAAITSKATLKII
jgi:hypothetical protein